MDLSFSAAGFGVELGCLQATLDESEWQTRKERIDTRLRSSNPSWQIVPWQAGLDLSTLRCHAVTEFPTANGPADYALFVNSKFLGIIEAKKVTVNPQNVLEQAKRYAQGAAEGPGNWNGYRVPFLYASNGEIVWHLDVRPEKRVSRLVSNFHTAPALEAMFAFKPKPAHDWLLDTPPDLITRLRDYQRRCIIAAEQAVLNGRRDLLLAMATGTGKTFLTVAQVYRLLKSGFAKRILFLVDRKALAAQAVREFNAFNTPQGNKFTQEYEVYSQKFQKEDFGEEDPFDPKDPNGLGKRADTRRDRPLPQVPPQRSQRTRLQARPHLAQGRLAGRQRRTARTPGPRQRSHHRVGGGGG